MERSGLSRLSDEYDLKYKNAHSDLKAITFTYSASGFSMRPKVEIALLMDTVEVPARVTVVDRTHLGYPVIIGKKNLKKFLVDVSK